MRDKENKMKRNVSTNISPLFLLQIHHKYKSVLHAEPKLKHINVFYTGGQITNLLSTSSKLKVNLPVLLNSMFGRCKSKENIYIYIKTLHRYLKGLNLCPTATCIEMR